MTCNTFIYLPFGQRHSRFRESWFERVDEDFRPLQPRYNVDDKGLVNGMDGV